LRLCCMERYAVSSRRTALTRTIQSRLPQTIRSNARQRGSGYATGRWLPVSKTSTLRDFMPTPRQKRKKKKSPNELTSEQRRYRRRVADYNARRKALIEAMGGKCVKCGTTTRLEFNHTSPRTWEARKVGRWERIAKYEAEWDAGEINLLCRKCNARAGQPPNECDCPFIECLNCGFEVDVPGNDFC